MNVFEFWDDVELEVSELLKCDFRLPIDIGGCMFLEYCREQGLMSNLNELKWLLVGRWLLSVEVCYTAWMEHLDPGAQSDLYGWYVGMEFKDRFWFLLEGIESGIVE